MDASWGGWTTVAAYDIDEEKGIAYFSYADIKKAWGDRDISTINSVCVGVGDTSSLVYSISILPAATIVEPTDPTEIVVKGDINKDGILNVVDLIQMKRAFMYFDIDYPGENYDWNADGEFNLLDIVGLTKFLIRKS